MSVSRSIEQLQKQNRFLGWGIVSFGFLAQVPLREILMGPGSNLTDTHAIVRGFARSDGSVPLDAQGYKPVFGLVF
jgi:hypothetical protein